MPISSSSPATSCRTDFRQPPRRHSASPRAPPPTTPSPFAPPCSCREPQGALPGKPILLSLGNNDSSCGDYKIDPGGAYLAATREAVRSLAGAHLLAADFDETYSAGGYYAARHPTLADTTVVVLDDVLWSDEYDNACGTGGLEAATAMMTWLETNSPMRRRPAARSG
jgi:hypothetical protein